MNNEAKMQLSSKTTFLAGLAVGLLTLGTIGFGVLLSMMLGGQANNQPTAAPRVVAAPTAAPPANGGGSDIVIPQLTGDEWYKGGENASVIIVEYSDTECPFCKRFHDTMNQVIDEYGDQVKWVYQHSPLDSLHRKARREAEAAECAGELGGNEGFWAFIDRLFEITPSNDGLSDSQLPEIAAYAGLDQQAFIECLDSGRHSGTVQAQTEAAVAAGLRGTPYSLIITDTDVIPISGAQPFAQVKSAIDSVLK